MAKDTGKSKAAKPRDDGRRAILLYMSPKVIKDVKREALEADRTAYECVEEAVEEWVARKRSKNK